jgi:hypothetical protein
MKYQLINHQVIYFNADSALEYLKGHTELLECVPSTLAFSSKGIILKRTNLSINKYTANWHGHKALLD